MLYKYMFVFMNIQSKYFKKFDANYANYIFFGTSILINIYSIRPIVLNKKMILCEKSKF